MALALLIGARLQLGALPSEIARQQRPECFGRIMPEPGRSERILGGGTRLVEIEATDLAEGKPAVLRPDLVLNDIHLRAAGTDPDTEAGQVVVEERLLALILPQREILNRFQGDLHSTCNRVTM